VQIDTTVFFDDLRERISASTLFSIPACVELLRESDFLDLPREEGRRAASAILSPRFSIRSVRSSAWYAVTRIPVKSSNSEQGPGELRALLW